MFRNYVEPTLTLMLNLLVTTPSTSIGVHQCIGKCLSALITTLGPELQDTSQSMNAIRKTCLTCCTIIQDHPDAIVQSAAIGCLQQLQLFAPQYVSQANIVPMLYENLDSSHLLLRRAAAICLRQFTQRDPQSIWDITSKTGGEKKKGLEQVVLSKLDFETDPKLCEDLREILFSLLTSLAPQDPMKWLLLCNGVLSASGQKSSSPGSEGEPPSATNETAAEGEGEGEEEDDVAKVTSGEEETPVATKISPRWPTKVFAVECSRKIYAVCKSDPAHFDLKLAQKQKKQKGGLLALVLWEEVWASNEANDLWEEVWASNEANDFVLLFSGDYLVMHLSELVRTSFIAATASVDQLKLAGYEALRVRDIMTTLASCVIAFLSCRT